MLTKRSNTQQNSARAQHGMRAARTTFLAVPVCVCVRAYACVRVRVCVPSVIVAPVCVCVFVCLHARASAYQLLGGAAACCFILELRCFVHHLDSHQTQARRILLQSAMLCNVNMAPTARRPRRKTSMPWTRMLNTASAQRLPPCGRNARNAQICKNATAASLAEEAVGVPLLSIARGAESGKALWLERRGGCGGGGD